MDIEELHEALDSRTLFHIALYDDDDKDVAGVWCSNRIRYIGPSEKEITLNSFAELIEEFEKNFSSGVKRFTVTLAIRNSLVEAKLDSADGIANFHRWGPNPELVRSEKEILFALSELLAKTLNVELPGPILSVTKTTETGPW